MANPQTEFNNLIPNVSTFGLALNVAGIINNKKEVALYIIDEKGAKQDVLAKNGLLGTIGNVTNALSIFGSNGVIIDCVVSENSKLAEHPLEDGTVRADNKVKLPTEITLKIAMPAADYKDMIEKIRNYRTDNQMLYVETKFGGFKNMQIVSIPCEMNIENISRVTFSLKLREVLVAENKSDMQAGTTENASDSSTQDTGLKTGTAA